jgi:hypothetical protein
MKNPKRTPLESSGRGLEIHVGSVTGWQVGHDRKKPRKPPGETV